MTEYRARAVAFYLPQFHPIPENNEWWGDGFTEWTNVARASRLFPGHDQPRLPGELGFYDLRLEETRRHQAELAAQHGVAGFCFWHYWFAGRRMLDRVVELFFASADLPLRLCLGWANESWGGRWIGAPRRVLIEQTYPGDDDHRRHFSCLEPWFHDRKYLTVDGRPVFFVYRPERLPSAARFAELWRSLAVRSGLPGLYLIGQSSDSRAPWSASANGFDAVAPWTLFPITARRAHEPFAPDLLVSRLLARVGFFPTIFLYSRFSEYIPFSVPGERSLPSILPNWDNTPRVGRRGNLYVGHHPEFFGEQVRRALEITCRYPAQERIILVRSWNEWAEGNYLEPDRKWGRAFLEELRRNLVRHP